MSRKWIYIGLLVLGAAVAIPAKIWVDDFAITWSGHPGQWNIFQLVLAIATPAIMHLSLEPLCKWKRIDSEVA